MLVCWLQSGKFWSRSNLYPGTNGYFSTYSYVGTYGHLDTYGSAKTYRNATPNRDSDYGTNICTECAPNISPTPGGC